METFFTDKHKEFLDQKNNEAYGKLMKLKESLIAEISQQQVRHIFRIFKEIKENSETEKEKSPELTEKLTRSARQIISFLSVNKIAEVSPTESEMKMIVFKEFIRFFPEQISQCGLRILQDLGMEFEQDALKSMLEQAVGLKELDRFLSCLSLGDSSKKLDFVIKRIVRVIKVVLMTQDITITDINKIFSFGLSFIGDIARRDYNSEDQDDAKRSGFAQFCTSLLGGG